MRALGCHVFAGGFTMGVRQRADIAGQLEIHDFGRETVESMGVEFINCRSWRDWPKLAGIDMLYGNPRCTGFSTMTSGYDDTIHGPFAKCTQDIRDLCEYGIDAGIPLVIWESVQQAYSVGRPLLDVLRDRHFAPAGYRIAHLFLNASSFGNAQQRRRYFFVAYRGGNFNIIPSTLPPRQVTVRDVIEKYEGFETREVKLNGKAAEYDANSHITLCSEDKVVVPHLREGECVNLLARRTGMVGISEKYEDAWDCRMSNLPFSLHCARRLKYDSHCPTMSSSCSNFIHPKLDRPLTVRELAAIMGWPGDIVPIGRNPTGQIAKGICPEVGVWLAEQGQAFLDGWGSEDWDSTWNGQEWAGNDYSSDLVRPLEKLFNLTYYAPRDTLKCESTAA